MPEYTFVAAITLVDSKQLKSTMRFKRVIDDLSAVAAFTTANTELGDLVTDLAAATNAGVNKVSLAYLDSSALEGVPAPGVADITDEAVISCWLSDVGQLDKYATLRVPAPIDMFESDQKTLDRANATAIAFVENFGAGKWEVSDGETVITTRDNGIASGFWRSRAKSTND